MDSVPTKVIQKKDQAKLQKLLKKAGFHMNDVIVVKCLEHQGCMYRTDGEQVVVHRQQNRTRFGKLAAIVESKLTQRVCMVLHDLTYKYVEHLGLYQCDEEKDAKPRLIEFEDLLTCDPLNLYTSKDIDGHLFQYVSLKEAFPMT